MLSSDAEDAFQIALLIADVDDDPADKLYRRFRKRWEKTLDSAEKCHIELATAKKIRRTDHGRTVAERYLNNPVLIGRTAAGNLIALDGNHRLIAHIRNENEKIPALILDISWLEDADDMEFEYP